MLGFKDLDIVMHYLRSGGAIENFLSGVSRIIIQHIGQWASDAFLECIMEKENFLTFGVSENKINLNNSIMSTHLKKKKTRPKKHKNNKDDSVLFLSKVKFSYFALGMNTTKKKSTKRNIK